jgi:hypothetical protein
METAGFRIQALNFMENQKPNLLKKFLVSGAVALLLLIFSVVIISGLSNIGLPQSSQVIDRLSENDKALLAEFFHSKSELGDRVWPGFGQADIPVILYNEEYAFLVGYPNPPSGWTKLPDKQSFGGPWQETPQDDFFGQPYYRLWLQDLEAAPEAFTVLVGERWTASMTTKELLEISLRQNFKKELPPLISDLLPYRLVIPLFVRGSDGYLGAIHHEAFHAFQGMHGSSRLESAEMAVINQQDKYPFREPAHAAAWQVELDLLYAALKAESAEETADLTRQFLENRQARRLAVNLLPAQVVFERQREWLEGLARYVELEMWREAGSNASYQPSPHMAAVSDFKAYQDYTTRWDQELDQIRRMASSTGDGRFYYSGMAQAFLLDRLDPEWKQKVMQPGVYLDDLLAAALEGL